MVFHQCIHHGIKNSINNNIFKASGTIQAPTGSNKQNGLKGFLGLALFIKSPGDTDFKLKGHKIISANMYTDCMNFQFDVLSSVKNLPYIPTFLIFDARQMIGDLFHSYHFQPMSLILFSSLLSYL